MKHRIKRPGNSGEAEGSRRRQLSNAKKRKFGDSDSKRNFDRESSRKDSKRDFESGRKDSKRDFGKEESSRKDSLRKRDFGHESSRKEKDFAADPTLLTYSRRRKIVKEPAVKEPAVKEPGNDCRKEIESFSPEGFKQTISFKTDPGIMDLVKDPPDIVQYYYDLEVGRVTIDKHWFDDSQEIRHSFSNDYVLGAVAYSEKVPPIIMRGIEVCPFDIFKRFTLYKGHHYAVRGDANTVLVVAHGVSLDSPSDPRAEKPNRLADYIMGSSKYAEGDMHGSLLEGYASLRGEEAMEAIDFSAALVRENKLFIVRGASTYFRLVRKSVDHVSIPGPTGKVDCIYVDPSRDPDDIKQGAVSEDFRAEVREIQLIQGDEMLAIVTGCIARSFDANYLIYSSMLCDGVKLEEVCEKVVQEAGLQKAFVALLQFPKLMLEPGKLSYRTYTRTAYLRFLPNRVAY